MEDCGHYVVDGIVGVVVSNNLEGDGDECGDYQSCNQESMPEDVLSGVVVGHLFLLLVCGETGEMQEVEMLVLLTCRL